MQQIAPLPRPQKTAGSPVQKGGANPERRRGCLTETTFKWIKKKEIHFFFLCVLLFTEMTVCVSVVQLIAVVYMKLQPLDKLQYHWSSTEERRSFSLQPHLSKSSSIIFKSEAYEECDGIVSQLDFQELPLPDSSWVIDIELLDPLWAGKPLLMMVDSILVLKRV